MNAKQYEKIIYELTNVIDEGVHVVDAAGKSIIYNKAMADIEKTKREDVIGRSFRVAFSHIPEDESTLLRALKQGEATEKKQQTYLNQYGKEITTENLTVPIHGENGEIVAALEISKDITDLKKMSNTILDLQGEVIPKHKAANPAMPRIKKYNFSDIIGENALLKQQIEIAKRASKTNASVFIYGETGTGKELLTQSIHFNSDRKDKPFLAQNCAALPESLLEGILFGTTKGGFTGAVDRAGLFEQANGGTLLLDEISAMPYELQGKLLRVLQEDYVRRIGGNKDIPVDVRIIATVNEKPEILVEKGMLRRDLLFRLNIINLVLPPLRERKDDIPLLVEHFIDKHNKRFGKEIWMIADEALKKLERYNFPGNLRELENIIISAVSLSDKEHVITEKLLNLQEQMTGENIKTENIWESFDRLHASLDIYLAQIETEIIKSKLTACNGNISKAAEAMGIKRQTLQHKIKKYNLLQEVEI